jgi:hypothetical protein
VRRAVRRPPSPVRTGPPAAPDPRSSIECAHGSLAGRPRPLARLPGRGGEGRKTPTRRAPVRLEDGGPDPRGPGGTPRHWAGPTSRAGRPRRRPGRSHPERGMMVREREPDPAVSMAYGGHAGDRRGNQLEFDRVGPIDLDHRFSARREGQSETAGARVNCARHDEDALAEPDTHRPRHTIARFASTLSHSDLLPSRKCHPFAEAARGMPRPSRGRDGGNFDHVTAAGRSGTPDCRNGCHLGRPGVGCGPRPGAPGLSSNPSRSAPATRPSAGRASGGPAHPPSTLWGAGRWTTSPICSSDPAGTDPTVRPVADHRPRRSPGGSPPP